METALHPLVAEAVVTGDIATRDWTHVPLPLIQLPELAEVQLQPQLLPTLISTASTSTTTSCFPTVEDTDKGSAGDPIVSLSVDGSPAKASVAPAAPVALQLLDLSVPDVATQKERAARHLALKALKPRDPPAPALLLPLHSPEGGPSKFPAAKPLVQTKAPPQATLLRVAKDMGALPLAASSAGEPKAKDFRHVCDICDVPLPVGGHAPDIIARARSS